MSKPKEPPDSPESVRVEIEPGGELRPFRHGRPGKFNPEIADKIVKYVAAGHYPETAFRAVGIGRETGDHWVRRGAVEESGPYHDFNERYQQALAVSEMRLTQVVTNAALSDAKLWVAAMCLLERRFPERWAKKMPDAVLLQGVVTHKESEAERREPTAVLRERVRGELQIQNQRWKQ
jgi:hypothetical protein